MAAKQRNIRVVPRAPLGRILEKAGAKRVSADAMDAFSDVIEKIGKEIGERAVQIAKHSGRKTVHEGDIKLAAR